MEGTTVLAAPTADQRVRSALSLSVAALRHEVEDLHSEVANLRRALESRTVIGQATGLIMAATGHDADTAFGLLAKQSQHMNIKVRDLAAEIVARATLRGSGLI